MFGKFLVLRQYNCSNFMYYGQFYCPKVVEQDSMTLLHLMFTSMDKMFGEALLSPINQEYSNYRKEFVGLS